MAWCGLVRAPNYVACDAGRSPLQLAPLTFDASTLELWGACSMVDDWCCCRE